METELHLLDPAGDRVAAVLRDTLDQIYDGQHTGRWHYDQLNKTEKTHVGTLVEINLHRRFGFADGTVTDYRIAGVDVDCKYSMTYGGWELPPEAIGQICLLITADDQRSSWPAGLLRVAEPLLRGGSNRDAKRQLRASSHQRIRALWPAPPAAGAEPVPAPEARHQGPDLRRPRAVRRAARPGPDERAVPPGPAAHHQARRARHRRPAGRSHEKGARQRRGTYRAPARGHPGARASGQRSARRRGARPAGAEEGRARLRVGGAGAGPTATTR